MSPNGPAGNGSSAAAATAASHTVPREPSPAEASPQHRSKAPHYNSFPSYHAIRHEAPNGHAGTTTQHSTGKLPAAPARVLGPDLLRGLLMMFMAMDHLGIALRPWEHGLGRHAEQDGVPVTSWNRPAGYLVRSLTHLCAPGFTLLLGMGVVYLGRARGRRQGWAAARLLRYYALRMAVLALVMVAHSLVLTGGQLWFLNIVLFALAVDYFLAGLVWLAVDEAEGWLTGRLATVLDETAACTQDSDSDAEQPLLQAGRPQRSRAEEKAASISWHLHNVLLVIFSVVAIFWNIWLSQNHGQCAVTKSDIFDSAAVTVSRAPGWDDRKMDKYWWLRLWFWETSGPGVLSVFPPLAWLSFAIVGVLYGRIVVRSGARTSTRSLLYHVGAGLVFTVVFVLTRLLHFGNLSEHCLQTPENMARPDTNQYLVSPAAFFYTIKYPPDVAFWALTLAANFFLLAGLQQIPVAFAKRWLSVVLDFGTTSLFFYVVHMPVVFLTGGIMCALFGHDTDQEGPSTGLISNKVIDSVFGFFGVWALCLLIMWPLCRWYGQFKFGKPSDSLWRIF
ncbi:hypothetical protein CCM_06727 [Cordyceps militaris CM01]|uniref:Heparan-alpha-glucosaminide N-acetyltransferase catalytic domain-containing protein n=1 Tax=Cordyceps militaris (strain CM01) TaxID=983644 RepID=G3JKT6_CORMM|nr:uncharacterized protein CCM_06727 [Cordyceps militaris CM01]EGX90310.1 hypothetical protein CCM_06727 [Cordyceps militaris CM01]